MQFPRIRPAILLVGLVLVACSELPTAPGTDAGAPLLPATVTALEGAVFLPPIGPPIDTTDFFADASLRLEVWTLDPQSRPSRLLTTLAAVAGDRYYQASWQVRDAAAALRGGENLVRVVATADDLEGSALERTCRGQRECVVGSFDALLKKSRSARAVDALDLTDTQTLPIKVWLQAASRRPTTLGDLRRLSDGGPFGNPVGNCLVNEFTMPGQGLNALGAGLNALGAVGGLFVRAPGDLLLPAPESYAVRQLAPAEAGAWAAALAGGDTAWSGALLVVDDFHGIMDLGPELWPTFEGFLGDQDATDAYLASLLERGSLSHGALVLHQTLRMVEAAGFSLLAAPSPDFRIYAQDGVFPYLVVAAVDVGGTDLSTSQAATRLGNALDALRQLSVAGEDDFDVLDVAVNMSFVLVPCSVLDDYQAVERIEGLATFEDYVTALGADNAVAHDFYDQLKALLLRAEAPADDPLRQPIEACVGVVRELRTPVVLTPDVAAAFKADPLARSGDFVRYPSPGDPSFWVEIRVRPDPAGRGELLDWRSSRPLGRVEVKGGTSSTSYEYAYGSSSGSGLHAPLAPNGRTYHDASHAVFVPVAPRPPAFLADGTWRDASWSDLVAGGASADVDCARGRINYLASSGNFGLGYAMFPAAWPEVVAVSAQYAVPESAGDPRKAGFANAGEVLAPGALYELSRGADGTQVVAYAGTSFSAPVVSLFAALDLMRDVPTCGLPTSSRLSEGDDAGNVPLAQAACLAQ